ncbi:DUF1450 domain-containing protein [Peribacillus muralis]|uniref:DUF1450 domain-containing protein n=1 Tax=Peribacillus muralis TaxID=264697 RepID=UPI001F4D50DC|nr:DUF1450 domain-containing protein [Peribacillus muralis]MCK1994361.1 YuzB family protein [Peribacillus muralis]MCK2014854.1 YuzB family protein [Peribacillus muralis]
MIMIFIINFILILSLLGYVSIYTKQLLILINASSIVMNLDNPSMQLSCGRDKIKITKIYSSNERSDKMKTFLSKIFTKKDKVQIEFCQNNLDRFLKEQTVADLGTFLANPRIQYKEYECLSECKLCQDTPYAKVNNRIMRGKDSHDLLKQLQEALK